VSYCSPLFRFDLASSALVEQRSKNLFMLTMLSVKLSRLIEDAAGMSKHRLECHITPTISNNTQLT